MQTVTQRSRGKGGVEWGAIPCLLRYRPFAFQVYTRSAHTRICIVHACVELYLSTDQFSPPPSRLRPRLPALSLPTRCFEALLFYSFLFHPTRTRVYTVVTTVNNSYKRNKTGKEEATSVKSLRASRPLLPHRPRSELEVYHGRCAVTGKCHRQQSSATPFDCG